MQTPTLSVKNYRGAKIYIRRLFRETFEYLIAMDGEIFCNQVEMQRPTGQRMTKYSEEDTESAVAFLLGIAHDFVDDRLFAQAQERTLLYRWDRFTQKVADIVFKIKYKLSIKFDEFKGKSKRLRRHTGNSEQDVR